MSRPGRRRTSPVEVAILCVLCLLLIVCFKLGMGPSVETRPKQYSHLLAEWQQRGRGLVDHFPKAIPTEATATKLSAFPGFLQGGAWLQIRLTLPAATVASIFEEATKQAKAFYDGGDSLQLVNQQKDGLPGASFHTADTKARDFPADYRIFIYDAHPYRPGEDFQWNHGDSRGVVINRTRSEVIFFVEDW